MGSDIRHDCFFVRIETGAGGWSLQAPTLRALAEISWLALEIDGDGVRGLALGDGVLDTISPLVRDLRELHEVEFREDIDVIQDRGPLADTLTRLGEDTAKLVGIFVTSAGVFVARPRAIATPST